MNSFVISVKKYITEIIITERTKSILLLILLLGGAISMNASDERPQLTKIPTLYIDTYDGDNTIQKNVYKYCKISVVSENNTQTYDSVQIRGRGNATWLLDKKPYRIKFPKKTRFLGKDYANAKNWVLLSNGGDQLLFRNGLANYVSNLCGMPFTTAAVYVDLYLNGDYRGNYQISDFIDIRKKRVDIYEQDTIVTNPNTDISGGYLLEVDDKTDPNDIYITSSIYKTSIRIHSPEPDVVTQPQIDYISNYINDFESVLASDDWLKLEAGWKEYVDSASLMGWYLTNEICANTDIFHQIFFYKDRGDSKLYFGPVWDFDHGFNNDRRRGDGGDCTEWLMQDIDFQASYHWHAWFDRIKTAPWWIKSQFEAYKKLYVNDNLTEKMLSYVDSITNLMRPSIDENYKIWDMSVRTNVEYKLYDNYDSYLNDVRHFISKHNEYLYERFKYLNDSLYNIKDNIDIAPVKNDCLYRVYDISGRYMMTLSHEDRYKDYLKRGVYIFVNDDIDQRNKIIIF